MSTELLKTPIEYLKGVGPQRADLLKKELGLFVYEDLLTTYPFRYVDKSRYYTISEIANAEAEVQIIGKIRNVQEVGPPRKKRLTAEFYDATGSVELIWFKGARWVKPTLKADTDFVLFGKPSMFNRKFTIAHPELEVATDQVQGGQGRMEPVYPSTEKLSQKGLNSKGIRKLMYTLLLQLKGTLTEYMPANVLEPTHLISREQALFQIHFPQSLEMLHRAQQRLKFDEFYLLQLSVLQQKNIHKAQFRGYPFTTVGHWFNTFYKDHLPFELTGAQKRVIKEIRSDMGSGRHMNRLVQGDVGSGKTMVALLCILIAVDNGFQAALMAPTEILAKQHYTSLCEMAEPMGLSIALLTGNVKGADRKRVLEGAADGSIQLIIGTHALIEPTVVFKNLGLSVIDEQHRFGVAQRAALWKKNELPPHILVMTATPIPRTLAMSVYGDLDLSVIDELPPGRKPITTKHLFENQRLRVFGFMKEQIALGRQIYIVYPLIEESEKLDYKDLMDGYEAITRAFPLPNFQVSIVHGQMKPEDKDREMERFVKGQTQIMVATTVIEVGVNVPNASVMIIESAEKFGLSQLHQLRGRVGRGAEKSYCLLLSGPKLSEDAKTRLSTMVKTQDGFEIADVDLKLRGPGDVMGTRQSGVLNLKIGDLTKDASLLSLAREWAQFTLKEDVRLEKPENRKLRAEFLSKYKSKLSWSRIS
ncbi:MAG: ATP-dependent DNA helicase RecG [Schleiferiaceae bacterium]